MSVIIKAGEVVDVVQQAGNGLKDIQTNRDDGLIGLSQVAISIAAAFNKNSFVGKIILSPLSIFVSVTAFEREAENLEKLVRTGLETGNWDRQKLIESSISVVGAFGGVLAAFPPSHFKTFGIIISLAAATAKEAQTGNIYSLIDQVVRYFDTNNWQSLFDEIAAKKQNSNTWSGGGGQYISQGASSLVVSTGTQGATTLANFEVETAKQPDGYLGICLKDDEDKKPRGPGGGGGPRGGVGGGVTGGTSASAPRDPLVLDLDGDGIELLTNTSSILFDHNADRVRTGTQWVKADDGLLVRDLNGNGTIDSGRELFGDQTQTASTAQNPSGLAREGFAALRALDSNNDNQITSADAAFAELKVWQDSNQDGVSQASELQTLSQRGISQISLGSLVSAVQTNIITGTPLTVITDQREETTGQSSFTQASTDASGTTTNVERQIRNINFGQDTFVSDFLDKPIVSDAIKALPQMLGSGMVRDMHGAMSLGTGDTTNSIAPCTSNTTARCAKGLKSSCKTTQRLSGCRKHNKNQQRAAINAVRGTTVRVANIACFSIRKSGQWITSNALQKTALKQPLIQKII